MGSLITKREVRPNGSIVETQVSILSNPNSIETSLVSKELGYCDYTYQEGVLTEMVIWADEARTIKLYTKTFTYDGSKLIKIEFMRESDSHVFTTDFIYEGAILMEVRKS